MTTPRIAVPTPCSQRWATMTPTPGGRHCAQCAKTVVDLRGKSSAEIAALYRANGGQMCGRVWVSQLAPPTPQPAKKSPLWRRTLLATWLGLGATLTANAQLNGNIRVAEPDTAHGSESTVKISGTINDLTSGHPVAGATVHGPDGFELAESNANGAFQFQVRGAFPHTLTVLAEGYGTQHLALGPYPNRDHSVHVRLLPAGQPERLPNTASSAQTVVFVGQVTDADNGSPLAKVKVLETASEQTAFTDENGRYRLTVPQNGQGVYELQFTHVAHETFFSEGLHATPGQPHPQDAALTPMHYELMGDIEVDFDE